MRPLIASLSLSALIHNIHTLKAKAPNSPFCAVIKANAYGHRIPLLLETLENHADYLAVACIEEALELRQLGATHPVLLLEGVFEPSEYTLCATHNFTVVIANEQQLAALLAADLARPLAVFLKVDSGMHRLGIAPAKVSHYETALRRSTNVTTLTLMSHFACADDVNAIQTQMQQAVMANFIHAPQSLCNSAAILSLNPQNSALIRAGIALYGVSPFNDKIGADLGLKPLLRLTSKIIHHTWINKGEYVGYGATYQAVKTMPIGIVACGYADGYPRECASEAYVLVGQHIAPIIGRVSMDMLAIDLSQTPEDLWDQEVLLFGDALPIEHIAKWANTIPYTILTHLAKRIHFRCIN